MGRWVYVSCHIQQALKITSLLKARRNIPTAILPVTVSIATLSADILIASMPVAVSDGMSDINMAQKSPAESNRNPKTKTMPLADPGNWDATNWDLDTQQPHGGQKWTGLGIIMWWNYIGLHAIHSSRTAVKNRQGQALFVVELNCVS